MRLYIAGPMTGIVEHNFPAFAAAAEALRRAGHEVVSPAEMDDPTMTHEELSALPWEHYLKRDIQILMTVDGVAVLPGWEHSKGATLEVNTASAVNILYREVSEWLEVAGLGGLDLDLGPGPRLADAPPGGPGELTRKPKVIHHTTAGISGPARYQWGNRIITAFDPATLPDTLLTDPEAAPRLIGLVGFARAGKDETAKVLIREYGFARVAFADALREMLYALNPKINWVDSRVQDIVDHEGWESAKLRPEVRALLQRLGTEAGRNVLGENVWVDAAFRKVEVLLESHLNVVKRRDPYSRLEEWVSDGMIPAKARGVVLTDVRFPNEADRVRDEGGELWYVRRPGIGAVNDHPSERLAAEMEDHYETGVMNGPYATKPYDRVLNNDGLLEDLEEKVRDLFDR